MAPRKTISKLDANRLWEYALRVLGMRAHSMGELRAKLSRKASTPADVAEVLTKLSEYGLVDDRKFSETFASGRLQNHGFGRHRVLRELRGKRVGSKIAEEAVNKTFADTDESTLIAQFLQRKYRGKNLRELVKDERQLASIYRRLRTAGFSSGNSLAVLRRYKQDIGDWDEPAEE